MTFQTWFYHSVTLPLQRFSIIAKLMHGAAVAFEATPFSSHGRTRRLLARVNRLVREKQLQPILVDGSALWSYRPLSKSADPLSGTQAGWWLQYNPHTDRGFLVPKRQTFLDEDLLLFLEQYYGAGGATPAGKTRTAARAGKAENASGAQQTHADACEPLILDIGANVGAYAYEFAQRLHAHVHAFEPVPSTFAVLDESVRANRIVSIEPHLLAVGERPGQIRMTADKNTGNHMTSGSGRGTIPVKVTTVDEFVRTNRLTVDFIKMDVEGMETAVLRGARKTLASQRPIVFAEIFPRWMERFGYSPEEIFTLFESLGYVYLLAQRGFARGDYANSSEELRTNQDFLFIPRECMDHPTTRRAMQAARRRA